MGKYCFINILEISISWMKIGVTREKLGEGEAVTEDYVWESTGVFKEETFWSDFNAHPLGAGNSSIFEENGSIPSLLILLRIPGHLTNVGCFINTVLYPVVFLNLYNLGTRNNTTWLAYNVLNRNRISTLRSHPYWRSFLKHLTAWNV